MFRDRNLAWRASAAAFMASATTVGVLSGALAGSVGSLVPLDVRIAAAFGLCAIGVVVGLVELVFGKHLVVQCNRETPKSWVGRGAAKWALMNGAALGFGASSRLGFSLWYVAPCAALLSGSALAGAFLYGLYAFVRASAPVALILVNRISGADSQTVARSLLTQGHSARSISSTTLLASAVAAAMILL